MQEDRFAIVTGTSSGLGAAIARALLEQGWHVLGMSRRQSAIASSAYRHVEIDLADFPRLQDVAQRDLAQCIADPRWKRIGLVNNAGAIGALRALESADPVQMASLFAVNAIAPVFLSGLVVRTALPAAALRIVNVSTGAALRPIPGIGDYGSSKAALRMAGMTMAAELASSERPGGARPDAAILSYAPGVVDTAMQETARSGDRPWNRLFVDFHARGSLVPAEAPAREVVQFLSSDAAPPFAERRYGES